MAGGSGVQGPARCRDEERCDLGDAGAGNGGGRQTRIHAAEVAVVRPGSTLGGLGCKLAARESAGGTRIHHRALGKRVDDGVFFPKGAAEQTEGRKKGPTAWGGKR